MATIVNIKQKIDTLDAGSFQNLCNSYLSKIGYPNIVALGSKEGTQKTTIGTPDTYFSTPEGKYVFVEYTTQKTDVFEKIVSDINKCLDTKKTGIQHKQIAEIVYCHTSSNVAPIQDNNIKQLCLDVGVKATLIGIDKLAEELYLYHSRIVQDFLGISLNTGQIQTLDDFVKDYNAKKIAAPIDTPFLFREQEMINIGEAFENVNIVILSGVSGAGKTRLAWQYANTYSSEAQCYCIHNKSISIYEDLKTFIDIPRSYFIVVDDANQLTQLQHVIQYATMKPDGYDVKILITVRDYAIQKVVDIVRSIAPYTTVNIGTFSDDEIKRLVTNSLGILNSDCLDRIVLIAEGNARIAILAGKIAHDTNRLDSINDVSQLYEDYYSIYLKENPLTADNKLLAIAGIVAFLEIVHLDYMDLILPLLKTKDIDRTCFIECIQRLHEMEIVDIYYDKVVRFSEQCLSNFLLKYIYFDKKLLSLRATIKEFFKNNRPRVIHSINTLLNVFRNEELYNFVGEEIIAVWKEFEQEQSDDLTEFIKAFFRVRPVEALLILQRNVEATENVIFDVNNIDVKKNRNYISVSDEVIKMLMGFSDMDDLPTALDLLFGYYLKRPDLFIEFYHAINSSFSIHKKSHTLGYITQITLFEKFVEHSDGWKNEFVTTLFIEVVSEFLSLSSSQSETGRKKNTITTYQISLTLSKGVEVYRRIIFESLLTLSKIEKYCNKVITILSTYVSRIDEVSKPVLQYDFPYIKAIIETSYSPENLHNCLAVKKIVQVFESANISHDDVFSSYFEDEKYTIYILLKRPGRFNNNLSYEEAEQQKKQSIENYVSKCNLKNLYKIIDTCENASGLGDGLRLVFRTLFNNKKYYVKMIMYYLQKDTPCNLNAIELVNKLFLHLNNTDIYELINSFEYNAKNIWLYAYFHELPQRYIDEPTLHNMYNFLQDTSDSKLTSSSCRNIKF